MSMAQGGIGGPGATSSFSAPDVRRQPPAETFSALGGRRCTLDGSAIALGEGHEKPAQSPPEATESTGLQPEDGAELVIELHGDHFMYLMTRMCAQSHIFVAHDAYACLKQYL